MYNTAKKKQTHIHHDNNNSRFWGVPSTVDAEETLNIIVDISNPVRVLDDLISQSITEGEYCSELRKDVIRLTCMSLFSYVQNDNLPVSQSNNSSDKAVSCLVDYQLNLASALRIYHETESSIIKALLNVVPDIDDENKYIIIKHKLIAGNGLYLSLKVHNA